MMRIILLASVFGTLSVGCSGPDACDCAKDIFERYEQANEAHQAGRTEEANKLEKQLEDLAQQCENFTAEDFKDCPK